MQTKEYIKKLDIVFAKLSNDFRQDFFRIVGQEFGYFDLPKKVGLKDVVGKKIFYRGLSDKIFLKKFVIDEYSDDFYIGKGTIGKGIYCSESKYISNLYTSGNKENVLKFYLKNCNMVYFDEFNILYDYFLTLYSNTRLTKEEKESFSENLRTNERFRLLIEFIDKSKLKNYYIAALATNSSALAVLLGYDVIINKMLYWPNDYLILNRSKIVVTDKEFSRVTGISKNRVKRVSNLSDMLINQKGE